MIFIYTTCKDVEQAKELGRKIIKARVAACVSVLPVETMYFWKDEFKEDQEALLIIKTNEPKMAEIESFLVKNHTYTTPLVASFESKRLNREYKEWMTTVLVS